MSRKYLREGKMTVVRKWEGGIEFKKRNHPGVWLGSCSQEMPSHKEIVQTLRLDMGLLDDAKLPCGMR